MGAGRRVEAGMRTLMVLKDQEGSADPGTRLCPKVCVLGG